jgi:Tfp pilus assembly protein PilN
MRAVNLIPSESRSGRSSRAGRSGGSVYAVLAALAGLAVLALLYGLAHRQVTSRSAEAASLSARAQSAQAQAAQLAPYASFVTMRQQRVQAVSELVDARFDWAHAFHELGRVLPKDATITSLDGSVGSSSSSASASASASKAAASPTPGGASASAGTAASAAGAASAATSATPPGSVPTFSLSGCATSQQEVALTIQRLRLIDGVSEVTLQSSSKAAAGGASPSGGCQGANPAFTVQIAFNPLPSSAAISSATKLTSANGVGR